MIKAAATIGDRNEKLETALQEIIDMCMTLLTDKTASDDAKRLADLFLDRIRAALQ